MSQRQTIGVGLISVGWMGKVHARAYVNLPVVYPELGISTRLVMAADSTEERAAYARDVLGFESVTLDYQEVLRHPDVDVVSICAPNFLHAQMARAAAEAGKAFWIEKPAGRWDAETEEIARAADDAGVTTAVGFNYRNAPAIEYARELIGRGELGRITNVRGAFFADYSADPKGVLSWRFIRDRAGTGVLGDLMGHLVDLVHYLVGPVSEVSGVTSTVYTQRPKPAPGAGSHFAVSENGEMGDVENEDYAAMLVRVGESAHGTGAVGTLEASRVSVGPRAQYALEIYGTEGSVTWDFERMNELQVAVRGSGTGVGFTRVMAGPGFGDFERFQPGAGTSMGYDDLKVIEAKKFVLAYLDRGRSHADIHDALAANRVVCAAEDSAQRGAWVRVAPVVRPSS